MARFRTALPWGIVWLFVALFFVAWWIEDCLIYYIDWRNLAIGHLVAAFAGGLRLNEASAIVSRAITTAGHRTYAAIATACNDLAQAFDSLPAAWREKWPLRLVAWVGTTLATTFGGDALSEFGAGVALTLAKIIKLVVALNGACWLYNLLRRGFLYAAMAAQMPVRFYSERETESDSGAPAASESGRQESAPRSTRQRRREYVQFFSNHVERIGIILAGGGARGAYQAGALKAIHEFLRDYNSLSKVRMIAGSSIGAWNAMFWLADMIEPAEPNSPTIETWWKSLSFGGLLDFPWLYIPFWSDSLLRAAPWHQQFQEIFRKRLDRLFEQDSAHFYFTRCDLEDGATHYSTNWRNIGSRIDELGLDKDENYRYFDVIEAGKDSLKQIADAIFAAMGLPPLFPRPRVGESTFEDVARENLPFRFGAPIENCDLLFVLPLDASKAQTDGRSIVKRLVRTIDVRQGTLDRLTLKSADLINRVAERMERIEFGLDALAPTVPAEGVAADALGGLREEVAEFGHEFRRLYLFTVCPTGQLEIDDFGFWKRRQASDAFDLMYVQTRRELQGRLFEDIEPEDGRVVLVDGELPTGNELPKPKYRRPAQL